MRKFKQNKLWRDKGVDLLEAQGSIINWRKLKPEEFQDCLKDKLLEEAQEVLVASNEDELLEELADVLEVVEALARAYKLSMSDIIIAKDNKKDKRGGFEGRRFVLSAEHPEGSFGEKYCLADPKKYSEIFV